MNTLLEKAFAAVSQLPEDKQEAIADFILDEMDDETAWDARFATTQDQLGELIRRARIEADRGDVLPYDPSDRPRQ